jgi:hypothetical protein
MFGASCCLVFLPLVLQAQSKFDVASLKPAPPITGRHDVDLGKAG